jgi:hypothetical protein
MHVCVRVRVRVRARVRVSSPPAVPGAPTQVPLARFALYQCPGS